MKISEMKELQKLETILTGAPSMKVSEAVSLMVAANVGAMPVMEGKKIVGIFSERDLMVKVISNNLHPDNITLEEVMSVHPTTIAHDDDVQTAKNLMREHHFRHLPVVDGEKLVGVISIRDFL